MRLFNGHTEGTRVLRGESSSRQETCHLYGVEVAPGEVSSEDLGQHGRPAGERGRQRRRQRLEAYSVEKTVGKRGCSPLNSPR